MQRNTVQAIEVILNLLVAVCFKKEIDETNSITLYLMLLFQHVTDIKLLRYFHLFIALSLQNTACTWRSEDSPMGWPRSTSVHMATAAHPQVGQHSFYIWGD